jgi:hypothetical protein
MMCGLLAILGMTLSRASAASLSGASKGSPFFVKPTNSVLMSQLRSNYSLDTKANFQFERRITRWRGKSVVDLRRKEYYSYVTWRDPRKRRRRKG